LPGLPRHRLPGSDGHLRSAAGGAGRAGLDYRRRDGRALHRKQGGRSLFQQGIELAEKEVTSLDEVIRVAFTE
jgi:hypothetical protein